MEFDTFSPRIVELFMLLDTQSLLLSFFKALRFVTVPEVDKAEFCSLYLAFKIISFTTLIEGSFQVHYFSSV